MNNRDDLYGLATADVALSKTYNLYIVNKGNEVFQQAKDEKNIIHFIEKHITLLNDALEKDKGNSNAYLYLSERIIYWANILLHEFDIYVDFSIPSPKSLFGE